MPDGLGADLLEVFFSVFEISSVVMIVHSISCGGGMIRRSRRSGGEGKKVLQKSSALLGLSLAIPLLDLRARVGEHRTLCPILAMNQILSRETCSRKLLAQTCLACLMAIFRAARSFLEV